MSEINTKHESSSPLIDSRHDSLTEMQAADLLNVSQAYFIELLNMGKIAFTNVGSDLRVLAKDVISYKEQEDKARLEVLAELTDQAQTLDMGYR